MRMPSDERFLSLRVDGFVRQARFFFSSSPRSLLLISCNISLEEYQYCQCVWRENNMNTLRDFLMWYNNLDVQPFCDALERNVPVLEYRNIDLLRQDVSIPSITITYLFMTLQPGIHFSLFDKKNKDLYYRSRKNQTKRKGNERSGKRTQSM